MEKKLLGYYNYTVILTYMGMLFGFTGIICVLEKDFFQALLCLMLAGVCDMFDGAVASTKVRTTEEKCYGIQIDSLSDLICFGVLPALYVYEISGGKGAVFAASAFYILAALIRLAFFNVDEQERQKKTTEGRKFYLGLPVTLSALVLPVVSEFCVMLGLQEEKFSLAVLTGMGVCFLLPFRLKKPDVIGKICVALCGLAEFLFLIAGVGDV